MKNIRRIGIFIALCTLLVLAFAVFADASEPCGDGLTYTYQNGTLTISGGGAMTNFDNAGNKAPWADKRSEITRLVVGEGVTSIGSYAFAYCQNLSSVSLPSTLRSIGNDAFVECKSLPEITLPDGVTSIGVSAFQDCERLTAVHSLGSITALSASVFQNCDALATVHFPTELLRVDTTAFYRTATSAISIYYADSPASLSAVELYNGTHPAGRFDPTKFGQIYYGVRVNVTYVMESEAEAPTPPATVVGFADGKDRYAIPVPEVTGHTHNVTGGVLTGSFVGHSNYEINLTVTYTPNSHRLTLSFVDHNGAPLQSGGAALIYTADTTYGDRFSLDLAALLAQNGLSLYTPERSAYDGMPITGDYSEQIRCVPPKYTLVVNYIDTLGRAVADPHVSEVYYTDPYSVDSPAPDYFDREVGKDAISGVMGAKNEVYTVLYTPHTFTLTVVYVDENGAPMTDSEGVPLETVLGEYLYGTDYSVESPTVLHYTPDALTVAGRMDAITESEGATHSRTVTVTYTLNSYFVIVYLQDAKGNQLREPYFHPVRYGEDFAFAPPTLEGYETETLELSGTMDDGDTVRVVTYTVITPPEVIPDPPKTHVWLIVLLVVLGVGTVAGAGIWSYKKLR